MTLVIIGTTDVSKTTTIFHFNIVLKIQILNIFFYHFTGVPSPDIIGASSSNPRSALSEPERKRLKHQVLTKEQEIFLNEWSSQPQSDTDEAIYEQERRRLFGHETETEINTSEGESEAEPEPFSEIDSETGEGIESESVSERETKVFQRLLGEQGQQGSGHELTEPTETNKEKDGSLPETSI